jgi:4-diphosphocytidyl-2-C-methyl-D-erythritol kinase
MPGAEFSLPSFAKINWSLRILGTRPDGFHELCTVLQTISLHDTLTFRKSDKLVLTCDDPQIPTDRNNLVIKAAGALRELSGVNAGAAIHLEKKIPSPGGLGGGSSNAATALLGLRKLWSLDVDDRELEEIASGLGSDVPFFLHGGRCLGTGRGETIEDLPDIVEKYILIVTPSVSVSTAHAYRAFAASNLTIPDPKSILKICRFEAGSPDLLPSALKNDLESIVTTMHPEIGRVKETLLALGASAAMMSGSGASVFALFDKEETRQTALKALDIESTWRKFAVATISRNEFREALKSCISPLPISF